MSTQAPVNRNDPCPCGSGRKYKKCCLGKGVATPPPAASAGDPGLLLERARQHDTRGRIEQAGNLYQQVLRRQPANVAALVGLSTVVQSLGRRKRAIALLRKAIDAGGRSAANHVRLAHLLLQAGDEREAWREARRAIALDPARGSAHRVLAACHLQMRRYAEALEEARKAASLDPADENAHILVAAVQRRTGDLDEARTGLARLAESGSTPQVRGEALAELGFVLDARGDHDAAFEAFERAGAALAESPQARRIDADAWLGRVKDLRRRLTKEHLAGAARPPDDGLPAPAFLVGFPRSGTTMTEQILAAHPKVVTTDEAPMVNAVHQAMCRDMGRDDEPINLACLGTPAIGRLRELYWKRARAELDLTRSQLEGTILLDKMPLNLVRLGLINVIFPAAKVIVALRDPRDVCLSCFMQPFDFNAGMVNFLGWERTGETYRAVMDLWLHLRGMIALDFIEVRYEDTVSDLEGQCRRILELLGLDWHERVARFHELAAKRFISTPSFAAVAEPVNRRAVGRWHNYARQLARIAADLEPYVKAFGYEEG